MIDLILDDCMNVMKKYDDNHFDLAIVDPPYGLKRFNNLNGSCSKFATKKLQKWNKKPTSQYFDELFRVSKKQIIWGANNFDLPTSEYFIVWKKSNKLNFSFAMVEQAWTNIRKPAKIFTHYEEADRKHRIHPTQKPVKLYKWILQNYAEKGQKILDTHLGSGSIAVACYYAGVDLVGIEIDEKYYNKAKERIDKLTLQNTLF
tara:strand:- start:864 stop:1472 length:609 start_codon:yes stop_codon:yes gene_type:complete